MIFLLNISLETGGLLKQLDMQKNSVGCADESVDEIEILKNSDTSMKKKKSERGGNKLYHD